MFLIFKMSHINLILLTLFVVCAVINTRSMGNAQRKDTGRLNRKVDKLDRKIEFLQQNTEFLEQKTDFLQKEIEDILANVLTSGTAGQAYENRTKTEGLGIDGNQDCKININETVTTVQQLKTEVNHLIRTSRDGLKHEKQWQRKTVENITNMFEAFQTNVTRENHDVKQHLEGLNDAFVRLNDSYNTKLQTIETYLNERLGEGEKGLEQMNSVLDELKLSYHKLETENRDLKETVVEQENDNKDLRELVAELQNNSKDLYKTFGELQNDNKDLRDTVAELQTELTKFQAASLSTIATIPSVPQLHSCDEGWRRFNGHCYNVIEIGKSWYDASDDCRNRNSYLIELTTEAEHEFVKNETIMFSRFWVGATGRGSQGQFVYQHSGEKVPGAYWRHGEPNNLFEGDEQCVSMMWEPFYFGFYRMKFLDDHCNLTRLFICEKP